MCWLYANNASFLYGEIEHQEILVSREVLEPIQGMTTISQRGEEQGSIF
jgi:hypothetical protein